MGRDFQKASITDVARLASVSPATVSRYLNHPDMVGEKTQVNIAQAIEMLGFVRNRRASSLTGTRSSVIGALVPTIGNTIFAEVIETFEQTLKERGFGLFLTSSLYDLEQEHKQVMMLIEQGVDALMLVGNEHLPETYRLIDQQKLPFVQIWNFTGNSPYPEIGSNNNIAARAIAQHLLDLGHRDFVLIPGITSGNDRAMNRLSGAVDILRNNGVEISSENILECEYNTASAFDCMRHILQRPAGRPTAVICGNDVIAHGALAACQNEGLSVPDELSIVGFGDFSFSAFLYPPLTTVRIPAKRIGRQAALALSQAVEDRTPITSTDIPFELKTRGTSGAAPVH